MTNRLTNLLGVLLIVAVIGVSIHAVDAAFWSGLRVA